MTSLHPHHHEDALQRVQDLGFRPRVAIQLVCITGETYAPLVAQAAIFSRRKLQSDFAEQLAKIDNKELLSLNHLNRRLRLIGLRIIPICPTVNSARIATRIYNGLRYLAKLEPFPEGS
jgi:hypothetical protein